MFNVTAVNSSIKAMSDEHIEKIKKLEMVAATLPQLPLSTAHTLHAGVYIRTLDIPPGVLVVGALIKIPTCVIIQGNILVETGEEVVKLSGYNIFEAAAHRKQAVVSLSDCHVSMIFATAAKTVGEAEKEFTDEVENLMTSKNMALEHRRI